MYHHLHSLFCAPSLFGLIQFPSDWQPAARTGGLRSRAEVGCSARRGIMWQSWKSGSSIDQATSSLTDVPSLCHVRPGSTATLWGCLSP